MAKMNNKTLGEMVKILGEINSRYKEMDKAAAKAMHLSQVEKMNKELKKTRRNFSDIDKIKKKWTDRKAYRALEKEFKSLGGGSSKLASNMEEAKNHVGSMWKAVRSGSPKAVREQAIAAGEFAEKMKQVGVHASKMGGALGEAGKLTIKMGEGLEGISKKMGGKTGIAVAIGMALVNATTAVDTYVKNVNKKFAAVRGPDILTPDVHQQFKDFNNMIFDINKNVQDALDPEQVLNFTEALGNAGVNISNVTKSSGDFRDMVTLASKASLNLGVDIVTVGKYSQQMMQNQKMSLSEMTKAFQEVSFDAGKSGMSADKFWNAIQNATASLSFFGHFLKGASHDLEVLSDTGVAGTEEMINANTEMIQSFSKGSTGVKAGFLEIMNAGGYSLDQVKQDFKDLAASYAKMALESETKINKAPMGTPQVQIDQWRKEEYRYNDLALKAANTANGTNLTIAANMEMLSDKMPMYLQYGFKGLLKGQKEGNLSNFKSGNTLEVLTNGMSKMTGISKQSLTEAAHAPEYIVNHLVKDTENLGPISETQSKALAQLQTLNENSSADDIKKMSDLLVAQLRLDEGQATHMAEAIAGSGWVKNLVKGKVTTKDFTGISDQLSNAGRAQNIGTEILTKMYKTPASEKIAEAFDATAEKLKGETFSMEQWKKIIHEGITYGGAEKTGTVDAAAGGHATAQKTKAPQVSGGAGTWWSSFWDNTLNGGAQASGTNYTPGGATLVGETGPELVNMPRGAQVYNSSQSKMMMSSNNLQSSNKGTQASNININVFATEKNMEWKITNGVREVLYKEQV